jgi:hypothetical protein
MNVKTIAQHFSDSDAASNSLSRNTGRMGQFARLWSDRRCLQAQAEKEFQNSCASGRLEVARLVQSNAQSSRPEHVRLAKILLEEHR